MKKIATVTSIILIGLLCYSLLFGKFFAFSPVIIGFNKYEMTNTIIYTQKDLRYNDFIKLDTIVPTVERFHELKFTDKPRIFLFEDSANYIRHSFSRARFCAFSSGRLFISPWAVKEADEGKISLLIYVRHELSHVLILLHKGIFSELNYPKWLLEGIAMYSSNQMGTSFYPAKDETYLAIAQGNFIRPFDFKTNKENKTKLNVKYRLPFMYSEFACIVDYLVAKYGKEKFLSYMKDLIKDNHHNKIFKKIYGIDFDKCMTEFKEYVTQNTIL